MSLNSFETILFSVEDGIAYIALNRPRVLNAYNVQMRDDLFEAFQAIGTDDQIRVLVISGVGDRAFCVGADLTEFGTAPSRAMARQVRWERDVWGSLLSLPIPTIAALHGYVLGSGLEIALCCDIRIAAENTQLGLPEASLGFIPAAGGTQTLPRIGGLSTASMMLLTAWWLSASEGLDRSLVHEVVPQERLLGRAEQTARLLKSFDAAALRHAKEAVSQGLDVGLAQGLALEQRRVLSLLT